jgi:chloramphenicol-sensitive protein RarD
MGPNRLGILYAILAYSSWGLFPIYWKFLEQVPAIEILSHRMMWSGILLLGIAVLQKRGQILGKLLTHPSQWLPLFVSASILAGNWGLYIYGVNSDRVIETSLGYFINPLVNVVLGVVVLRERLHWGQWIAVFLATCGVSYSMFAVGQVPWIALGLAFSFAIYGLLRKIIVVQPLLGLTVETCLMTPVAMAYLLAHNNNQFGQSAPITLLLIGCGVVTSFPLFCFNSAAQHLQLSTLGFFQYIAPSFQLLLGVWVYHEPFTSSNMIVFSLIWSALALYSAVSLISSQRHQN